MTAVPKTGAVPNSGERYKRALSEKTDPLGASPTSGQYQIPSSSSIAYFSSPPPALAVRRGGPANRPFVAIEPFLPWKLSIEVSHARTSSKRFYIHPRKNGNMLCAKACLNSNDPEPKKEYPDCGTIF